MHYKLIAAGLIGTFLEIHDMSVYGFFAPLIANNFFPSLAENSALLSTFSIFFIGFVVKPANALLFGGTTPTGFYGCICRINALCTNTATSVYSQRNNVVWVTLFNLTYKTLIKHRHLIL